MYLKQIELENFKSFGGKVTVPLMEGYMAVTGPNGSGKSNIADAILFVLGPRSSKAVRASRITDLIFDGGAAKSKAKFMKVSLVFDNSDRIMPWDDDTVILTRYVKLSENGTDYTSYFFINDQKSSLSEFDTLLTKARISADGYNIVQQGDVTHIVQMGNIERRRILDGISGIASFDADIDKAKGERAEASSNLERIDIIRAEKERQISALEKDREQAKVYLEAKKDLDIANAQIENVYCKHDGSLDDGFEIVTHPMSLEYHINEMPWCEVLGKAQQLGYRSHQANTCGLHVHVSRKAFGETEVLQDAAIARVLFFIEKHWNERGSHCEQSGSGEAVSGHR